MRNDIVDGFQYNLFLENWTERYYPLALAQLEPFRRARGYRPRWYTVPDKDVFLSVPAYATVEEQVRIAPGSILWGLSICVMQTIGMVEMDPSSVLAVQITEGATGLPLFSDFTSAGQLFTQVGLGLPVDQPPVLLSQPRIIVEPGYVNVEIANITALGISNAQLLLFCMEPAVALEECLTECEVAA
jgi:hypothetical protein